MSFLTRVISIENLAIAEKEMLKIGVHGDGIGIMAPKAVFRAVKIKDVSSTAANILKQDMLSRGGDAATSRGVIDHSQERSDVLLFGTLAQFESLASRLKAQQFRLPEIAENIKKALAAYETVPPPILGLEFGKRTYIMGVLNVTPDSFSDGGEFSDPEKAVLHAKEMVDEGADIIDVGGESTRPGAKEVDEEEEINRVVPVISAISKFAKIISIDTRKSRVAEAALKAGASMINDVSGLRFDKKMANVAAANNIPVVIMHSKGNPDVMQKDPKYEDLIFDMLTYFDESITIAKEAGIKTENIILDPGIGFGKSVDHNLEILKRLDEFRIFGRPVCVGTSRKSFIGKILGEEDPVEREAGTAATVALAVSKKVDIIRVHNAGFMGRVTKIADLVSRR